MLNFAQFSSTMNLTAVVNEVKGDGDHSALLGRLQSSTVNRNWDSIEELWNIKEKIKTDPDGAVANAFHKATAGDVIRELESSDAGRTFLSQDIENYSREFGFKSMFAHEFSYKTWRENPAPVIEAIRGYLEVDYDYPAEIAAVAKDLEAAVIEVSAGILAELKVLQLRHACKNLHAFVTELAGSPQAETGDVIQVGNTVEHVVRHETATLK